MNIRPFDITDYNEVWMLLADNGVEPPMEPSDLGGVCLVAEDKDKIVGCMWALVGNSTQAYIDYTAVHKDYRDAHVSWQLLQAMDQILVKMGVKRYTFYIEKDNERFLELIKKYGQANGTKQLRDLHFFRREFYDEAIHKNSH